MKAGNETGGSPYLSFGARLFTNTIFLLFQQNSSTKTGLCHSIWLSWGNKTNTNLSLSFSLPLSLSPFLCLSSLSLFLSPLFLFWHLDLVSPELLLSYPLKFQVYCCRICPTTTFLEIVNNAFCCPKEFWLENMT